MGVRKTTFTFSKSSISVDGGSTGINLTRDNQSYTNKLLHGYGDIYTFPAGATDYTWAPTAEQLKSFFQETPSQKIRPIDVYLDTYNGTTKVGRDTHTLQVALSEETGRPTISNFAITDSNSAARSMGIIVVGKSSLTASVTVTPKYGASIVKSQFMYGKKTSGTSAFTNGGFLDIDSLVESLPLTETPTNYVIGYMVGDSRGFSSSASSVTKSLVRYQAPHIDNFEVVRRDASGNEDENGTKALVIVKGGWSAMRASGSTTDKNTATLKVGYKAASATSYTYQTISVTGGTVDVTQTLNATLAAGTDYVFSVQLADKFETCSESGVGCSNVQNILYVSADGNTLTIGSDVSNNVMIDPNGVSIREGSTVSATFTKDKIELGKNNANATIDMRNSTFRIASSDLAGSTEKVTTVENHGDNFKIITWNEDPNTGGGTVENYREAVILSQFASGSYKGENFNSINLCLNTTANYGTFSGAGSSIQLYSETYETVDSVTAAAKTNDAIYFFSDKVYFNHEEIADFVVAQGTSGLWYYRKWHSGYAELWGGAYITGTGSLKAPSVAYPFTLTSLQLKIASAIYRSGAKAVTVYSGTGANIGGENTGVYTIDPDQSTSAAQAANIEYYVTGWWK